MLAEPALTNIGIVPPVDGFHDALRETTPRHGATLTDVLTEEAFARMIALGERFEQGVQLSIDRHSLPWHVTRLGCRVEYLFRPGRPRTGSEAAAGGDPLLDQLIHLWALNRGILLTPFHNMALMSPATTEADVDRHTEVFGEAVDALFA